MLLKVNEEFQVTSGIFEQPRLLHVINCPFQVNYNLTSFVNLECEI